MCEAEDVIKAVKSLTRSVEAIDTADGFEDGTTADELDSET